MGRQRVGSALWAALGLGGSLLAVAACDAASSGGSGAAGPSDGNGQVRLVLEGAGAVEVHVQAMSDEHGRYEGSVGAGGTVELPPGDWILAVEVTTDEATLCDVEEVEVTEGETTTVEVEGVPSEACEPGETTCSGGVDDDLDGRTDCEDPQCAGAACDDGEACTLGDVCGAGRCAGTALDCDDGEACSSDSCVGGACLNEVTCTLVAAIEAVAPVVLGETFAISGAGSGALGGTPSAPTYQWRCEDEAGDACPIALPGTPAFEVDSTALGAGDFTFSLVFSVLDASAAATATVAIGAPCAPPQLTEVSVDQVGPGAASLSATLAPGSAAAIAYTWCVAAPGAAPACGTSSGPSYTATGLSHATPYTVSVVAESACALTSAPATATFTTLTPSATAHLAGGLLTVALNHPRDWAPPNGFSAPCGAYLSTSFLGMHPVCVPTDPATRAPTAAPTPHLTVLLGANAALAPGDALTVLASGPSPALTATVSDAPPAGTATLPIDGPSPAPACAPGPWPLTATASPDAPLAWTVHSVGPPDVPVAVTAAADAEAAATLTVPDHPIGAGPHLVFVAALADGLAHGLHHLRLADAHPGPPAVSPLGPTAYTLTPDEPLQLAVSACAASAPLTFTWTLDGAPQPSAGATLGVAPGLAFGPHTAAVTVTRTDTDESATVTFDLTVTCTQGAQCDDGDPCTSDECLAGACQHTNSCTAHAVVTGPDTLPQGDLLVLDGSASYGDPATPPETSHAWSCINSAGQLCGVALPSAPVLALPTTNLPAGAYTFQLTFTFFDVADAVVHDVTLTAPCAPPTLGLTAAFDLTVSGATLQAPLAPGSTAPHTWTWCLDGLCVDTTSPGFVLSDLDSATAHTVTVTVTNACGSDAADIAFTTLSCTSPADCDDGDPCTIDSCTGGACASAALACDDGDPCTDDTCDGGACLAAPVDCDDGNSCTVDTCADGGCSYALAGDGTPCDDGDPCWTDDTCAFDQCVAGPTPLDCDDGDPCTVDLCVHGEGACLHPLCPAGTTCDASRCFDDEGSFAHVPAGPFVRGCLPNTQGGGCADAPTQTVSLTAFDVQVFEVTVGAMQQCAMDGACATPGGYCAPSFPYSAYTDYAAGCTKPLSAAEYCAAQGWRLCTEAEWEKAARGTDGRRFPWGNAAPTCAEALVDTAGGLSCGATTAIPGGHPAGASPYGVEDLVGNVTEWVADWYDAGYYELAPALDPQGPGSGTDGVLRGGHYAEDTPSKWLTWTRTPWDPVSGPLSKGIAGFRCCRDAP